MDHAKLKTEYAINQDFEQLVTVSRGQVSRREVLIRLAELGKFHAVMSIPEVSGFLNHPAFDTFEIQHPVTQNLISSLVSGGILTSADAAAINALGTETVPRWKSLGFERAPVETDFTLSPSL